MLNRTVSHTCPYRIPPVTCLWQNQLFQALVSYPWTNHSAVRPCLSAVTYINSHERSKWNIGDCQYALHYTRTTQHVLNVFYSWSLQCGICRHRVQLSSPVYSLITKPKKMACNLKLRGFFNFLFGWNVREEKVKDEFSSITHNHFRFNRIKVNSTDQFFPLWFGGSKGMVYRLFLKAIFLQMDNFIFNSNTSVSWKPNILPALRGWKRSTQEDRKP